MKTIRIFLASSNELKLDREQFEIEIGRKNKLWREQNVVLHLTIWEDYTARMSHTRSQDEYNKIIEQGDVFVLLAHTKVGNYTEEEFETAFGNFQKTKKPFIFTYLKTPEATPEPSLYKFKNKLSALGHFYCSYNDFNDLWNQFNKELDRLLHIDFSENDITKSEFYVDNSKADIKSQFINSTFNNPVFNYNGKKIPKHLGSIPVRPDVFIGRDNNTKEIHEHFQGGKDKNLLLLVNGEGGIGKTTMASKYYHEYTQHYQHLIWLVSEKGIKEAIVSLALPLQIQFQPNFTQEQQVDEVLRHVLELNTPILLVIDNANDLEDLKVSKDILQKFQNVDILITSRVDNYTEIESYKVNHLHPKAADKLFKQYYKAFKTDEQELLDQLLKAIGYNTLVIELLAKNLHEFNTGLESHYPLQKLLDDIQDKGVLQIQKSTEVHTSYMEAATPEAIINSMYDISPLSDDEQQILSIFGVLPATVLPYQDLKKFLPKIEMLDRVLIGLSRKGWIDYDEEVQSFKTNPIIAEITRVQNNDRLEKDTLTLVEVLINKLKYNPEFGHIEGNFEIFIKMVSYGEIFINYFKVLNYDIPVIFARLGDFHKAYGNLTQALTFFEEDLRLTKELYKIQPDQEYFKHSLAIAYQKIGITYTLIGNLEQALFFFKEDMKLMEELHESNLDNVVFKNGLAIAYEKIGETYIKSGNLEQALTFFKKDMKLSKELYVSNPDNISFKHGLAIVYQYVGAIHKELGNLEVALSFFKDEVKLSKELNEIYPTNASFKNGLATAYEKLGDIYTELGNLELALFFFKDEVKLFEELHKNHPTHLNFKNNLSNAYERVGETHRDLENTEKALPFFENAVKLMNELYKSNPNHASFKHGLAISFSKLGSLNINEFNNKETGISYMQKAFTLSKDLTEKYPNHAEFKESFSAINNYLKTLKRTKKVSSKRKSFFKLPKIFYRNKIKLLVFIVILA